MIAIAGRIGAGKDTIADYLVKTHDYAKYSFSSPLKKAIKEIFHLTDAQLNGNQKEIFDAFWQATPRKIMQTCGTELFRNELSKHFPFIAQDLWILSFEKQEEEGKNYVISDLRFENELAMIRRKKGLIIKVRRDNELNSTHQSEQLDILADILIENSGSKEELYSKIEQYIVPRLPERSFLAKLKYHWFWHKKEILISSFILSLIATTIVLTR